MRKTFGMILSFAGMIIILYSVLFLAATQQELINLVGVLFVMAGAIVSMWSVDISAKTRWLLWANVLMFVLTVIAAIIKTAIHA